MPIKDIASTPHRVSNASLAALTGGTQGVLDRIAELEVALNVIIGHWDEFGPEQDFAETIEIARQLVK